MILGIGIDIVSILRLEQATKRWGIRFLERIYTPEELEFCIGRANEMAALAARFAAKEACSKALATGIRNGVSWRQMEIVHEPSGKPTLRLCGYALEHAKRMGAEKFHLSLTHETEYAGAVVVIEGKNVT